MSIKQMLLVLSTITLSLEAALPCDPCSFLALRDSSITTTGTPNILAFSSQNCLAVGTGADNLITVYRLDEQCRVISSTTITGPGATILGAAFSPTGSCLAVANSNSGITPSSVTVYSVGPDCVVNPIPVSTVPVADLLNIAISSTGCVVATAAGTVYNGTIDEATCTLTLTAAPLALANATPVFSADGNCVAFYGGGIGAVLIFPVAANCTVVASTLQSIPGDASSVAFGPSGCLAIANLGSTSVSIYAPSLTIPCTYTLSDTITDGSITSAAALLAFSSNNCLAVSNPTVAFASTNRGPIPPTAVAIYSINPDCSVANGGVPIQTIPVTDIANPGLVAYSPNGACLAVADPTGVLLYGAALLTPVLTSVTATAGCDIAVTGITSASVNVTIFVDGVPATTVASDVNGNFSAIVGPLLTGTYTITAQAFDPATGCPSALSAATTVAVSAPATIDTISPTCLGVLIAGRATANTLVTLFVDGVVRGIAPVGPAGTFVLFVPLTSGTYTFSVADTTAGCTSTPLVSTVVLPSCMPLLNSNNTLGACCNRQ